MPDAKTEKVLEQNRASDMKKTVEIKDDGRQLIYYDFSDCKNAESSKEQEKK